MTAATHDQFAFRKNACYKSLVAPTSAVHYGIDRKLIWWHLHRLFGSSGLRIKSTIFAHHKAHIIDGDVTECVSHLRSCDYNLKIIGHFIDRDRVLQPRTALIVG